MFLYQWQKKEKVKPQMAWKLLKNGSKEWVKLDKIYLWKESTETKCCNICQTSEGRTSNHTFKCDPWRRQWHPLQSFCLKHPMDRGAWWAAVHGVAKSRTWLSDFTFSFHFHALEKEMAAHSSVLAWRIPGTGSHRVGHDWSDLAAAVAVGSELMPSDAVFVLKWFIEV